MAPHNPTEPYLDSQKLGDVGYALSTLRVKSAFNGRIFITYLDKDITFPKFQGQLCEIWEFPSGVGTIT